MANLYYSLIGVLALIIFLIVNSTYYINKDRRREIKEYKRYLAMVFLYILTDIAWGLLSMGSYVRLLYLDTVFYYVAMALSVVFCCRYIIVFLDLKQSIARVLNAFGIIFAFVEIAMLVTNTWHHLFFWFDEAGNYQAYPFRHIALGIQLVMFGFINLMSLRVALTGHDRVRHRNMTIFFFSLSMTVALTEQTLFPLLPLYSVGLILGMLFIHVFIHNEEQTTQMKQIEGLNEKLKEESSELQSQKDEIASAFAVINGLSYDYHTIWLADKATMKIKLMRAPGKGIIMESLEKALQIDNCDDAIKMYIDNYVCDEDKERMRQQVSVHVVLEELTKSDFYTVNYRRKKLDGTKDYNQMTFINVETSDLKNHFVFGFRDVNDIVLQEMALRKEINDAKIAAEANIAANEAKTKFLQNMSHEIRTPLNAMFGFAQLLGMPDGSWTEEEKQQYNAYIYNSYRMLEMLISDILDIADSEHSNYRIELSDVNVNEVCRSAQMSVEFRVPVNVNLSFTTDLPDGHIVRSDSRRIQQVLINYLTNACKNTEKGEIHLHCSQTEHPGKITFSVTDTGRGIPADKAALIFNRFTKLDQFVQGSGLGLNICMTIADKLGGEVYLDTTYTNGARFVFVIDDKKE